MNTRRIAFLSFLFISSTILTNCTSDTNNDTPKDDDPTTEISTLEQFDQVNSTNRDIQIVVERTFNTFSGIFGIASEQKTSIDCPTVSTENDDREETLTIVYGEECDTPEGNKISGTIVIQYNKLPDYEKNITYTLKDIITDGITINGTAQRTFTFNPETRKVDYETTSKFDYKWENGLTAISEFKHKKEVFKEDTTGLPEQDILGYGFDFYTITTGSASVAFSNDDIFSTEIIDPLRYESICGYTVQGIEATVQNSKMVTTDYGDGTCNTSATQTDSDGNETIIEIDW